MGCRIGWESERSASGGGMGCAWRACLAVACAVVVLVLGAAAGAVEAAGAGNFETTSKEAMARVEVMSVPVVAVARKLLLTKSTTESGAVGGAREGGAVEPAEVVKGGDGGLSRWRMKIAVVRQDDSSAGVATPWGTWFKVASPPGPPGPVAGTLPGTGRIPLRPGEEVVRASLHPVPSGPNPLHN